MTGRVLFTGVEEEENLAIRYLAAVLSRQGYEIRITPFSGYSDTSKVMKSVDSWNPHVLVASLAFQSLANQFFELLSEIKEKKPKMHVTLGGHFPTFEYEKLLKMDFVDSIIRFEGETPLPLLVDSLLKEDDISDVPNLLYKDQEGKVIQNLENHKFPDVEELPFPIRDKNPRYRLGERFATLVASRGCFYSSCLYCCIGAFHKHKNGSKYAVRTPENVAKEMGDLYHSKGVKLFQFHDDNFLLPGKTSSLKRIDTLKNALSYEDVDTDEIAVLIKTRPDSLSEDVVSSLVELGTVGIFLGVENASKSGLKALKRGSTLDDVYDSMEILKVHPISYTFNLLIFHPTANLDEINDNIYFMSQNLNNAVDFGRAEIVAGSPLEELVRRRGLLRGEWPKWDYIIEDPAVEKMFRINSLTFYNEKSIYPKLSHMLIALSYRTQLLERFYPGQKSNKFKRQAISITERSNRFTLKNLLRIYEITARTDVEDEIYSMYSEMEEFYSQIEKKLQGISNQISRFQLLEQKFGENGLEDRLQNSKILDKIFRI